MVVGKLLCFNLKLRMKDNADYILLRLKIRVYLLEFVNWKMWLRLILCIVPIMKKEYYCIVMILKVTILVIVKELKGSEIKYHQYKRMRLFLWSAIWRVIVLSLRMKVKGK